MELNKFTSGALLLFASACGSNSQAPNTNAQAGSGSQRGSGNDAGAAMTEPSNGLGSGSNGSSGAGPTSGGTPGRDASSAAASADAGRSLPESGSDAAAGTDAAEASMGGEASTDGSAAGAACTRDSLGAAIDAYFTALAAHDPTKAPLASNVKYTENGMQLQVGSGEWKTAGAVKFKRSALDTQICNSVTESVIADSSGDLVYGLRLKLDSGQITEIETIPVIAGSYITISASGLVNTGSDDWETVLPTNMQPTRDQLTMLMDVYFTQFPNGACNFASDCMRVEDGQSIGSCTGFGVGCNPGSGSTSSMTARLHVLDVEAGISVGFTMFAGQYTDFHMFKVRGGDGQVHGVHAVLSSASSSGWN